MKPHLSFRACTVLLALAPLALAQDPRITSEHSQARSRDDMPAGPLVLSVSDLVLEQYQVKNTEASVLSQLAKSMIAREFFVKEHGGSSAPVVSVRQLGGTLVLYDTKEEVQRAIEMLRKLDVATPDDPASTYEVHDYKPRYLSLAAAREAVQDLVDVNVSNERSRLVLTGSRQSLKDAEDLLARIDVPEKQVLLTCLLLDVDAGQNDPRIPRELSENLQRLLPESHFSLAAMALLKTSVRSGERVSIELESTGKRYAFALEPAAFDDQTGSLTARNCTLMEFAIPSSRTLFTTNTILRGNEYTVLAGTGASTRLLVVRFAPEK